MAIQTNSEMTQREVMEYAQHKEMFEKQAELQIKLKELEIDHLKMESRWNAWFRIPVTIVKLPVYVLFGLGYVVHAIRQTEPSDRFWDLLK